MDFLRLSLRGMAKGRHELTLMTLANNFKRIFRVGANLAVA